MVIAVGSETTVVAPLSTNHEAALAAIDRLDAWGTTPLYDAIAVALDAIQSAKGRRALVVLSDGSDRYSEITAAALVDLVRRRDVLVYPVAIGADGPRCSPSWRRPAAADRSSRPIPASCRRR